VSVAWQSPLSGTVAITGRIADVDTSGGDGVAWEVRHGSGIGPSMELRKRNSQAIAETRKQRDAIAAQFPRVENAYAVCEGPGKNTQLQRRGDPKNLGDEIPRRFLEVLGGQSVPAGFTGSGRLHLAEWLTNPANPLTARVMVNRLWQYHFGRGLVWTPNDFGVRGRAPSHPELLDFLATALVKNGWSIKKMHRLLMLSDAWQRSSFDDAKNIAIDHDNEFFWRFNARRLDAEEIRDTLLMVSGQLNRTPAAAHPFPAEDTWNFTQHSPFTAVYDSDRRSVYLMTQRIKRHPYLALFDGPDPNSSTPGRRLTTVPTQALFFLNDPFVFASAAKMVARLIPLPDEARRMEFAFENLFGRSPSAAELEMARAFLKSYRVALSQAGTTIDKPEETAWAAYVRVLFNSNEFVHID